jgi:hypothetical protein
MLRQQRHIGWARTRRDVVTTIEKMQNQLQEETAAGFFN